jgi:hypothetical protein
MTTTTVFDAFWHDCLCPDAFIANGVSVETCPTHVKGVLETGWIRTGYGSDGCTDCLTNEAEMIQRILGYPLTDTAGRCHEVSLALVRSGIYGEPGAHARVARGFCDGVRGQHSWIVRGPNPYARGVPIVDPTLWSGTPDVDPFIWHGHGNGITDGRHWPHGGTGTLWNYGKPSHHGGETIALAPPTPLSPAATTLLDMIGPLDFKGWLELGNAPVGGWCAAEIFAAMADTRPLSQMVPIDVLGMVTDRNPGGLYW